MDDGLCEGWGRGGKVISIQDNHSWWFPSTMLWPYKKFVFPKISIFLNGNYYYFYYYSSSFIYLFIFIIMMMMFGSGFLWWKKLERKAPLCTCASLLLHLLLESDRNRKTGERERTTLHRRCRLALVGPPRRPRRRFGGFSLHGFFSLCFLFPQR